MAMIGRTMHAGLAALALMLATGVANARDLPPIKTIGIIADIGDTVTLKHVGFMVFSNAETAAEFPDWKIGAFIAGDIEAALKSRYEFRAVAFAKGSVAPDLDASFWKAPSPEENVRANAKPADGVPLDAYLVVWPGRSEIFQTNQRISGLGLYTRGNTAGIYAALQITLIDGRTFEKLDRCTVRTPDGDINNMRAREDFEDIESFDAMTPAQKQALEQGLKSLVHDGLAFCLKDMKLTP